MGRRAAATILALAAPLVPSQARAHPGHGPEVIDVGEMAFTPATATVGTGETVVWVWGGPDVDHTVTADPGQAQSFDSDPDGRPSRRKDDYFSKRFTREGRFSYFCRVHADTMRGEVVVVAPAAANDTTPPQLSKIRVNGDRRRVAFTVSEGATVLFRIERRLRGRWRGHRDFDLPAAIGRNRMRLPVGGLAAGRYRVRLTAYDLADNRSRPRFARLVLRRR